MRVPLILSFAATCALSACNNGDSVSAENESTESVARKVAAANIKPLPGRWESTIKMQRFDMEGMPQQAKDAMAKQMAAKTISVCLTPEQVNKPDGGFFAGGVEGCTYKTFTMAGGRIDADMTCGQNGMSQQMKIAGTYGADKYDIAMNMTSEVQPGKRMTMATNVASRRTGDCDGKEDISAQDMKKMEEYAKKNAN